MAKFTAHAKVAILFIAPQLIITLLFFIWPAWGALRQSLLFSDAFGLNNHYAGLTHFIDLARNYDYLHALLVTCILTISISLITMTLGLTIAVLVHGRCKGQRIYKTLLMWPYAVAPAVAAILWRFLCHPSIGWLTHFLQKFSITFNYTIHAKQALCVVIMTACWQQFSYNFLFFFAALKMIPVTLVEAAIMDGASPWRRFWQIIFPMLMPTTFFLLAMNLIYSCIDTFGIIHVITRGGPAYGTTTLMYKAYEDGFRGMDLGSSAAQSVILMMIMIGLTLLQFRYLEKRVHYQ